MPQTSERAVRKSAPPAGKIGIGKLADFDGDPRRGHDGGQNHGKSLLQCPAADVMMTGSMALIFSGLAVPHARSLALRSSRTRSSRGRTRFL